MCNFYNMYFIINMYFITINWILNFEFAKKLNVRIIFSTKILNSTAQL